MFHSLTSLDFLQGSRVLAASYDKSALLWRLDDSVPKVRNFHAHSDQTEIRHQRQIQRSSTLTRTSHSC